METQRHIEQRSHPRTQKKSRAFWFLPFALGALMLLNSCSSLTPQTVTMDTHWAQYYRTMKDLRQHSDFAVRGVISHIAPAVKPADGPVYSMVTVSVTHALWNPQHQIVPTTVTVEQMGGEVDNITYVNPDDPLFQMNEQVILFLQEYQPGQFRIAGGPSGRFTVTNGVVKPVATDGVQLADGTTETQFSSLLQTP